MRWANFFALASTIRPSRANNVAHWARKHERLERKIAPAQGVKGRRETFFAHARSQEPFLTHFNRAGAMFLSLRTHARNWSNPLGRYFFQDQTKTTDRSSDPDAPNQTPPVSRAPEEPEGLAAVPVGGGARAHTCPPGDHRRACGTIGVWLRRSWAAAGPGRASRRRVQPHISDTAPPVWRAPEGPEGQAAAPVGGGKAWPGFEIDHSEPQARVWRSRGRAAAHGRTKQPGLTKHTQRPEHQRRNKQRHRKRNAYSPRNALIAGISRTACTRPAR